MGMVFHLGAIFQETAFDEAAYHKVSSDGAFKLCKAAAEAGVGRLVHCSRMGVHSDVKEIPCKETSPFNPMDTYPSTKLAGELAILDFARTLPQDGMVVTVDRPSMVYDPSDLRMLRLFRMVLEQEFVMIGDGQTLVHFGHIDDQVDNLLDCAVAPREKVHLEVFDIASDTPITLENLVRQITEYGGAPTPRCKIPVGPVRAVGQFCEILWSPFDPRPPCHGGASASSRTIGAST